jgi:hypothetical protein
MRPLLPLMSKQIALHASHGGDLVATWIQFGLEPAQRVPGQHGLVADVVSKRAGAPVSDPDAATSQI